MPLVKVVEGKQIVSQWHTEMPRTDISLAKNIRLAKQAAKARLHHTRPPAKKRKQHQKVLEVFKKAKKMAKKSRAK